MQQLALLTPSVTYRFDQSDSSNSGHPLLLSTTSNGTHGGGSAFTTGVTAVGTPGSAGAYTQVKLEQDAPDTLYYYCTNHSGMGGEIDSKATISSLSDLSVTATAAELNIMDGVTATTAELNKMDGVTVSASDINTVTAKAPIASPTFTGDVTIPDKIVHDGDTNTAIRFPAADTVSFETAGSERFRVASAGQLGIAGANYGTSGQLLTSGGSSAAPSWTTPSTPLRTKISTANLFSAASSVGITLPTSGYTYLELHIEGVRPANDEVNFQFELSDDGGSSTETMTFSRIDGSAYYALTTGYTATTASSFAMNRSSITNTTASDFNAVIKINIPTSTTKTSLNFVAHYIVGDDGAENTIGCADLRIANVTANFIRFSMSSGNISDGNFVLYGIA